MATIKGFQLKNVKHPIGREGYGLLATMYLNGKKIGTYEDYGDGALGDTNYVSKDARADMMKVVIAHAKENHNEYIENMYRDKPDRYTEEVQRFKKCNPFIPDEDITIQTMSMNDEVYIISAWERLADDEKQYKKFAKDGYDVMGVKGDRLHGYKSSLVPMEKIKDVGFDKLYTSLDDFNVV